MEVFTHAPLSEMAGWILLFVRVAMGATFLHYGWPKITNLSKNADDFSKMGFRPGRVFGTPIAFLETFGSIMLIAGIFVWELAVLFAIHMTVGMIWKITKTDKGFANWSYNLLLLALALVLLAFGAGRWALENVLA